MIVFGIHSVQSVLQQDPDRVSRLLVLKGRDDKKVETLLQLAKQNQIEIKFSSRDELDRLSEFANHQGILAYCESVKKYTEQDLESLLQNLPNPKFILILDGVQDPHNLGACLRTADAAGVQLVIAPKDKSVGITPTVSKIACGAAETVPFVAVTNLARTLDFLKEQNIWIYGTAGEAEQSLYATKFSGSVALVLGGEESGLRRLTREKCDFLIKIPMHGSVSSLNVSVATGVCLFEARRQISFSKNPKNQTR